jgi:cell division protein FtsI/penicillin-binding protein 2
MAYAALANDGKLMQPYIVSRFVKPDGEEEVVASQEVAQPISPSAAVTSSAMLVSSVQRGIAQVAAVPGYKVAGKTGTAQVPDPNGDGYSKDVVTSFAGFFPHDDPQYVLVVKFDKPKAGSLGSTTAGPVFKEIAAEILKYSQIPPQ